MNILENNLNSAIDVYIDRVDGAPCASTGIHLYKGPKSDIYQNENEHFKVFIKGNKVAKEELKKTYPELFAKFERVWGIRKMHLETTYPLKYIFLLRCCYKDGCDHPVCLKGRPIEESTWYPNGPPLSYIPIPTPDPNSPFGGENCNECKEKCSGHYMKPDELWEYVSKGGKMSSAKPPSDVIQSTFQQYKGIPPRDIIEQIAEEILLPLDEVDMWFEHVKQASENRARGAKKEAESQSCYGKRESCESGETNRKTKKEIKEK
jgi:hypothetical protein